MSDQILIKKGISLKNSHTHTPLATWEWNMSVGELICSDAFFQILGLPSNTTYLSAEQQSDFFEFGDLKRLVSQLNVTIEHGLPFEQELKLIVHSGIIWVKVFVYAIKNADNEVIILTGILRDITKDQAERAILKEYKQYQKALFDNGNEALILIDAYEHKILDANKTCEHLTGYNKTELCNYTIHQLCHNFNTTTGDKINSLLKKTILSQTTEIFECEILTKSKQTIWLEMYARYAEINGQERIIVSARDITSKKLAQQKEKSNDDKHKFLVKISMYKAQNLEDFMRYILIETLKLTKSTVGFIQHLEEGNNPLITENLKDRFEPLDDIEKNTIAKLDSTEFWKDIVLLRRPIIDNSFDISLHLQEVFKSDKLVNVKYMAVPIFRENKIVATLGVVNTKRNYLSEQVTTISEYLNALWEVINLKEFSAKLTDESSPVFTSQEQSPFIIETYDINGNQTAANKAYEDFWGFPASTTINSFNILKSIEIRNSKLYDGIIKAYSGEIIHIDEYEINTGFDVSGQKWFSTYIYPIRNKENEIVGLTLMHEDISEKVQLKRAQEKDIKNNAQQKQWLLSFLDELPMAVFWKKSTGEYLGCNKQFATDANLSNSFDIIGKFDDELNWNKQFRSVRNLDLECVQSESAEKSSEFNIISGGEEKWYSSTIKYLSTGNNTGIIFGTYSDISALKNLRKALETKQQIEKNAAYSVTELMSTEGLEDVYEYITKGIQSYIPDSVTAFTSVNKSETKLTFKHVKGLSDATVNKIREFTKFDIKGKNFNIFPTNYEIYKRGRIIEFAGGLDLYFGVQFPSVEARQLENLLSINHIYTIGINQGELLLGVVHIFSSSPITEEQKSTIENIIKQSAFVLERKTLESKSNVGIDTVFKSIENASDPCIITDVKNGIVIAANERSYTFFSRDAEDTIGYHYSVLFPKHFREEISNKVSDAIKNEKPFSGEFWIIKDKNQEVPVIISTSIIHTDTQAYLLLLFHSIEKRKEAESLVEQHNRELQQLISTKDKLFSIISHDLKNPLTGIVGFAEVVKDELEEEGADEQLSKFMDIIIRSADSMVYLINNLLHWSRIQQGVIEPKAKETDINTIVDREFELLFTAANNKNITLINEVEPNAKALADTEMISTVVRNLVSNAIKFTPEEGEITVKSITQDDIIEIQIIDTGIGMSKEMCENLFKISNETQRKGTSGEKGTGLGLVICKDFVEQNNGTIWVDSIPNKGTTFHFTLNNFIAE